MGLLNYTTQIEAGKSVGEIQTMLAQNGAMQIMLEINPNGVVSGISFRVPTQFGPTAFTLPCKMEAVLKILEKQSRAGKVPRRYVNEQQAARVGWRIIKDWTEAQLALIQTGMVEMDQVFLPFARTDNGKTVYERYLDTGMSQLLIGN